MLTTEDSVSPLAAAFDVLYSRLYTVITESEQLASLGSLLPAADDPSSSPPELETLMRLASIFGLSAFECDVLLLAAAVELDGRFPAALAQLQGFERPFATFAASFALSGDVDKSALADSSALRFWGLVEIQIDSSLSLSPLRISPRILQYLIGNEDVDEDVLATTAPWPSSLLSVTQEAIASDCSQIWARRATVAIIEIVGPHPPSKLEMFRRSFNDAGLRAVILDAAALPHDPSALERTIRRWLRELRLNYDAVVVDCDGTQSPAAIDAANRFIKTVSPYAAIGVIAEKPLKPFGVPTIMKRNPTISAADRLGIWRTIVGDIPLNGSADTLAGYEFSPEDMRALATEVAANVAPDASADTVVDALLAVCSKRSAVITEVR